MVLPALLTPEEISQITQYGDGIIDQHAEDPAGCPFGIEIRSGADDDAWKVAFLNTGNASTKDGYGYLETRIKEKLQAMDGWGDLLPGLRYGELNVRVLEYHRQTSPGPGI